MSDDNSSSSQGNKSWLERISQAFSGEPQNTQDILEILRAADQRNIIDSDALSIFEGAMSVVDMPVREVMIPRTQMITVKASQAPSEYLDSIISSAHSRFPVLGESPDEVIGILLAKDLLPMLHSGELKQDKVIEVLRPATVVPESKRLNQLLKEFKATRNHMAIVIDEYGCISGLITIEDILEQIVGEIDDEHDFDDEALITKRVSGEYIVKAVTPIEEFNEYFSVGFNEDSFDTIGGIILKQFGRLPQRGESIELDGFRFKVLNADNRTVKLLQVNLIK